LQTKIGWKNNFCCRADLFACGIFCAWLPPNIIWYIYAALFFLYGIYAAIDGRNAQKRWISNITDRKDTATAIGNFIQVFKGILY
jgi:hypothetical protein